MVRVMAAILPLFSNYERCIANPRFLGTKLLHSTFADPNLSSYVGEETRRQIFDCKPASITQARLHLFRTDLESNEVTGTAFANDRISPETHPSVHTISFAQRELIYHESRGHDGRYKATSLYQYFLELCTAGQKLSIQIKSEPLVLVDPLSRSILDFRRRTTKFSLIFWAYS